MPPQTLSLFDGPSSPKVFFFLIVISPPGAIDRYVSDLKTELFERYGSYPSRHSKPHITICSFPLLEERQQAVTAALQDGLSQIDPFLLHLRGFSTFDSSRVIYLDVEPSGQLDQLRAFFSEQKRSLRLGKKFDLFRNAHLTIAKSLQPAVFEPAKQDYLSRRYQNSFTVHHLQVLRYDPLRKRYLRFAKLALGAE
jgi:2'-5' RNA ligase